MLELSDLGCSSTHNNILHVSQRTALGPAPPKTHPGDEYMVPIESRAASGGESQDHLLSDDINGFKEIVSSILITADL